VKADHVTKTVKWSILTDLTLETERGIEWFRALASRYDTSGIQLVKVSRGVEGRGVYGRIWWPTKTIPGCRISCFVPGPFPCDLLLREHPVYRESGRGWPDVPAGCVGGARFRAVSGGRVREWQRVYRRFPVSSEAEGLLFVLAHELGHYLLRTKQIRGRHTEIAADEAAVRAVQAYRANPFPAGAQAIVFDAA